MDTQTREQQGAMPGPGEAIPTPPDFSVTWKNPGDEKLFWQRDRMHFPDPLLPLTESLFVDELYEYTINRAMTDLDMPITMRPETQNGYIYQTVTPKGQTPEEMEALGRKAQETLGRMMPTQLKRWNEEFLPEVNEHVAALKSFDLENASPEQLRRYVDETVERTKRIWEIHFEVAIPAMVPVSLFEDLYRDLLGEETALDAHRLLQGAKTKITETGLALWALSRKALALPEVRRVLEEEAAADVIPALERTEEGRSFLADLRAYLEEYGKRGSSAIDFDEPSWIEDPTPVIKMLKDYVGQPDRDLEVETEALASDRERAVAEARERLQGYPEQVRGQFEFLLDSAQQGIFLAEEHNFHIDYNAMYSVRMVFEAVGRRLVKAGAIEDREDIYWLTLDEIRGALDDLNNADLRGTVAARKVEEDRRLAMQAPPMIGTMPPGPPPDDPLTRTFIKFFGGPPQTTTEPNAIQGTPGSPGVARGTARVLHSLKDAGKLQKGDIIVAEATATPWTPLFATAAGIVTDTGGVLSHAAVAAREYGIPAVAGATVASMVIKDGQTIEVDGYTGLVRIVDAA